MGGWELNGFYTFQSGQPFTVTCPVATTADFGCSANVVAGQSLYAGPHNFTQWLNPSAFAQPPTATQIGQADYSPLGTSGIQQVRGPHFNNLDSSILKNFNFTEAAYLQFRAEAFNTTNTPPFVQPQQLNFQAGSFSNIGATKNSNGNNGARTLQLALKMSSKTQGLPIRVLAPIPHPAQNIAPDAGFSLLGSFRGPYEAGTIAEINPGQAVLFGVSRNSMSQVTDIRT